MITGSAIAHPLRPGNPCKVFFFEDQLYKGSYAWFKNLYPNISTRVSVFTTKDYLCRKYCKKQERVSGAGPNRSGEGGFRLKPHIEVSFKWMWFQSQNRRSLIREVCNNSITGALTARFDIAVSMFAVGDIDQRRYLTLSAVCCLQWRLDLTRKRLLMLQSRTADE